eukprot:CAMPEP_0170469336 /NCGR_PEP_ID=MMETSP0123-20130129/12198_1 /TAXON_ID=182087 /ORGANISM="Favella ehrenbergii, Strain Fehren 1" /LENGTH=77 /DNA_ID=CAMNT_0010736167 /DNA_START=11 /DNA_END=244 /DNA_ORIENTATION=-
MSLMEPLARTTAATTTLVEQTVTGKGPTTLDSSALDITFKTSTESDGVLNVDVAYQLSMTNAILNGDTVEVFACFHY